MPRKPHGKPLKPFPVRIDEDVRAALKKLARQHPTTNEGLRELLDLQQRARAIEKIMMQHIEHTSILPERGRNRG